MFIVQNGALREALPLAWAPVTSLARNLVGSHGIHAQTLHSVPYHPAPSSQSIKPKEAQKFAMLAGQWWAPDGPFAPLHRLNPARCQFIRGATCAMLGLEPNQGEPLMGLRVLDVGCGGGILSESVARMGAWVHGIDVTHENIGVAKIHAQRDPLLRSRTRYQCMAAEDLILSHQPPLKPHSPHHSGSSSQPPQSSSAPSSFSPSSQSLHPSSGTSTSHLFQAGSVQVGPSEGFCGGNGGAKGAQEEEQDEEGWEGNWGNGKEQGGGKHLYDVVLASEVIEHVRRPDLFVATLSSLVKPGGALILSTLNRTPASYAVAILGAEVITGMVPRGTHDWNSFITPEELCLMAKGSGLSMSHAAGMVLQPATGSFKLTSDLGVNYIVAFHKLS